MSAENVIEIDILVIGGVTGMFAAIKARGGECIEMMLRAALFRTESRGVYYREDYPLRDDPSWLAETVMKNKAGGMELKKKALPRKSWISKNDNT